MCLEINMEQELMLKCDGDGFPWAAQGQNTFCCFVHITKNSNHFFFFCFCICLCLGQTGQNR